jgi:hypothetical protein
LDPLLGAIGRGAELTQLGATAYGAELRDVAARVAHLARRHRSWRRARKLNRNVFPLRFFSVSLASSFSYARRRSYRRRARRQPAAAELAARPQPAERARRARRPPAARRARRRARRSPGARLSRRARSTPAAACRSPSGLPAHKVIIFYNYYLIFLYLVGIT